LVPLPLAPQSIFRGGFVGVFTSFPFMVQQAAALARSKTPLFQYIDGTPSPLAAPVVYIVGCALAGALAFALGRALGGALHGATRSWVGANPLFSPAGVAAGAVALAAGLYRQGPAHLLAAEGAENAPYGLLLGVCASCAAVLLDFAVPHQLPKLLPHGPPGALGNVDWGVVRCNAWGAWVFVGATVAAARGCCGAGTGLALPLVKVMSSFAGSVTAYGAMFSGAGEARVANLAVNVAVACAFVGLFVVFDLDVSV
jgi:hypothetical protein